MNTEQEAINWLAKLAKHLADKNQEYMDRGDYDNIKDYVRGKIDAYNFMADAISDYVKEDADNDKGE